MNEVSRPLESGSARGPVLVTGAAGFLGSRVVARLSAAGRHVVATDVVDDERGRALAELPGVRFQAAELRDVETVTGLVAQSDYVVHLAAVRSKASQGGGQLPFDVNVGATYSLLSAAAATDLKGFVYGSSHLVYGDFADPTRWCEESDATPVPDLSLYSAAKLASEAFVGAFSYKSGFDYLCLRFGGIYGPQAAPGSNTAIMTEMLASVDRGVAPVVNWSRDTKHCLIYVDDAARAVVAAVGFPASRMPINVVDQPRTAEEIYSELLRLYGADPSTIQWNDQRSRYQQVRSNRLVEQLNCPPETTLRAGLARIIEWYRAAG